MEQPLTETLRRLSAHRETESLNSRELAAQTALPENIVRELLRGGSPPPDTVQQRVCARIKALAEDYLSRTDKKLSDLVSEVADRLAVSEVWARKLLKGEKMPNVPLLHDFADFFDVEGGETFFTMSAEDSLNRVLQPILQKYENPASDPVQALMKKYGVVNADLRHAGSLTPEQLEVLLAGVIRSVLPSGGDSAR
ncbi:hypothetical protein [Streptomyces sp. ATCC 21386]|uniref:hypothetical protein n=1 Tax=Streptomyces sp. ATCC 21386 TaxID=2699428 RepID=UPI0027E416FB|nr:hypothetical protein [Streptomyces sp. ATCC 21386]